MIIPSEIPTDIMTAFWVSVVIILLTLLYNGFMMWVNWKQAKVCELMKENNIILRQILEEAKK